ncbi:hypothetical protein HDU91_005324, partial [Kappamyces sp. JEL0680]
PHRPRFGPGQQRHVSAQEPPGLYDCFRLGGLGLLPYRANLLEWGGVCHCVSHRKHHRHLARGASQYFLHSSISGATQADGPAAAASKI